MGNIQLKGMALACLVGMFMSLIFYIVDKYNLTNDKEENGFVQHREGRYPSPWAPIR